MKKLGILAVVIMALAISGVAIGQEQTAQEKPKPKVVQRQINQQKRIEQGVKSGQLTKGKLRSLNANKDGFKPRSNWTKRRTAAS